jgi:uncharacterized protein YndB with AHSA1/START domain
VSNSVRKEILVEAPRARAFRVFTASLDSWWPREHKIGRAGLKRAVMEERAGGRWFEIDEDGSECEWGKVLVWEPPQRIVLAWQITGDWRYDASFVTEVEVTFEAVGPSATKVALEHKDLDRFGDAREKIRAAFESPGGWVGLLEKFARAAEKT